MAGLPGSVHIRQLIHGLHIDGGLHDIHIKIAVGLHPPPDILPQTALKLALIGPFQDDLAQLHQKNFVHILPFLLVGADVRIGSYIKMLSVSQIHSPVLDGFRQMLRLDCLASI